MQITCTIDAIYENPSQVIGTLIEEIDIYPGILLASGFDFPGRYSRFDIGFSKPPLQLTSQDLNFTLTALNEKGQLMLGWIQDHIEKNNHFTLTHKSPQTIQGNIIPSTTPFSEENRSKQNSIFTLIRSLVSLFQTEDPYLGLYGAFGYDLAFQIDPIIKKIPRNNERRDLVLYIPDEIIVIDHNAKTAQKRHYHFECSGHTTRSLSRNMESTVFQAGTPGSEKRSHEKGEYAKIVQEAKAYFQRGDLFEVVPSQSFYYPCLNTPSKVFSTLSEINPAPYSCFMNLSKQEYLVGASPEMFVRTQGKRIETCPIAGTIPRGKDAIEDAKQILTLLSSEKERSELMMCTDVDRNDKSRVCVPGTVRVIGHRQIEMYSKLIHTVDHVEGILRDDCDAIDAFLSHAWAVTLTGAPKLWAMRFIENHEKSPRHWYGGAIGMIGFDGNINTGITLRTMRIKNGEAEIRAGATLLMDADPQTEEQETEVKAAAAKQALEWANGHHIPAKTDPVSHCGEGKKILLLDYEDSFVHTLANYFKQTGATVTTLRTGWTQDELAKTLTHLHPDLVVLSPGPGTPEHFKITQDIKTILTHKLPIFGICLGLQALITYFGGKLDQLPYPIHGKESEIFLKTEGIFKNAPQKITVGRYHSLIADPSTFPHTELEITASTSDNIVMAIQHKTLPIAAVQFHPESLMTTQNQAGLTIIKNAITVLTIP